MPTTLGYRLRRQQGQFMDCKNPKLLDQLHIPEKIECWESHYLLQLFEQGKLPHTAFLKACHESVKLLWGSEHAPPTALILHIH